MRNTGLDEPQAGIKTAGSGNTRHPERFLFLHTKNERVANKPLKFKDTGEPEPWYSYTRLGRPGIMSNIR